jgi:hypothetical protein
MTRIPRNPKPKHVNGPVECPACAEKLKTAHPNLRLWFLTVVRPKHPDAHISDAWRGEKEQNEYVAEGRSEKPWPLSKHNKMDDQGTPCSLALDLFQLASNGMGVWSWIWFKRVADECLGENMRWLGDLNGNGKRDDKFCDGPHFELVG